MLYSVCYRSDAVRLAYIYKVFVGFDYQLYPLMTAYLIRKFNDKSVVKT